jgi:hypothetical protein
MPSPFDKPQPDPRTRGKEPAPDDLPNYRKIYRRICDMELIESELRSLLCDLNGLNAAEHDVPQEDPFTFETISFSEFIINSDEILQGHQKKVSILISDIRRLVLG